jgi:hypothetical protein
LDRLAKACGVVWEKNALRHSCMSHRLAETQDEGKVVLEHGTSVKMLRKFYDDPKTPAQAKAWYSITPDDGIIPLPLQFLKA